MTQEQHLLLKLIEECTEVAHRASKYMQFGSEEKEPGQDKTNADRLLGEIVDLLAVIGMVEDSGYVASMATPDFLERIKAKQEKVQKFLEYSIELGYVKGDD